MKCGHCGQILICSDCGEHLVVEQDWPNGRVLICPKGHERRDQCFGVHPTPDILD